MADKVLHKVFDTSRVVPYTSAFFFFFSFYLLLSFSLSLSFLVIFDKSASEEFENTLIRGEYLCSAGEKRRGENV
jgi:hypothetical protein